MGGGGKALFRLTLGNDINDNIGHVGASQQA